MLTVLVEGTAEVEDTHRTGEAQAAGIPGVGYGSLVPDSTTSQAERWVFKLAKAD
jgi:hypothetical protein